MTSTAETAQRRPYRRPTIERLGSIADVTATISGPAESSDASSGYRGPAGSTSS